MALDYDWPGNVRELAAVIERAVILGNGHHLDLAAALGTHHRTGVPAPSRGLPVEQWSRSAGLGPIATLDQAIALPNIYFDDGQLELEQDTPLAAMSDQISAFGQKASVTDLGSKVNGAQFLNGAWTGAADPRSQGTSATIDAKGKVKIIQPPAAAEVPLPSVG